MRSRRSVLPLLVLLALAAGCAAAVPAFAAAGKALLFTAPAEREDLAAAARARGATVRVWPGALELEAAVAAELAGRALRIELLPDPHRVELAGGAVDLREHPLDAALLPSSAEAWPLIVAGDGWPDAAFGARLEAAGARVVGSLPPSAFLVRATAAAARRLEALPGVAAVALYQPRWKLSPRLTASPLGAGPLGAGPLGAGSLGAGSLGAGPLVAVEIVLFAGAGERGVLATLDGLGAAAVAWPAAGRVIVTAELPPGALEAVAALSEVEAIDPAPTPALYNNEVRVVMQTDKTHFLGTAGFYNPVYALGVWGASQIVTAADTGIEAHEVFSGPFKVAANVPAGGTCAVSTGDAANHGTGVAATLLGDSPFGTLYGSANDRDGLALRSRLILQDIDDDTLPGGGFCPPMDYPRYLFQPAWAAGSFLHTNSWGHNALAGQPYIGGYSWRSQMVDAHLAAPAFREQSVFFAAGNAGACDVFGLSCIPYTLSDEAHAKNAVAVGGSGNGAGRNAMYRFSSRGPANDCLGSACSGIRRVKPDVVAPAQNVDTAGTLSPTTYASFAGTSIAAPAVAGAAALVRDYFAQGLYPNGAGDPPLGAPPSSALVKAMLVNATVPLYDTTAYQGNLAQGVRRSAYPNYDQGYGRPTLDNVLEPAGYRKLKVFEDATTVAATGSLWSRSIGVAQTWGASCNSLRVTLAWNDEPGTLGAGPKLVNDLDLEVVYAGGTYRGNHRLTGGASWDRVNNVEDVFVPKGYSHPFTLHDVTVRVYGSSVPAGPQPWAVVLTYGACADNLPCPPPPPAGGCYRGPGDVVPGSSWTPASSSCGGQTYQLGDYDGSEPAYPRCEPPDPYEPGDPGGPIIPTEPEPVDP